MSRKFVFIGLLMLSLGISGVTGQTKAANLDVNIPTGAAGCAFDYTSNCAYNPNPSTINSGDTVTWHNEPGNLHTATSDDSGNSTAVIQPVAPGNAFSTELMFPGATSTVIGPFNTAVNQSKLYHCSLHPTTMGGTLNIMAAAPATTSTVATTTTSTTTSTRPTTTTSTLPVTTTTSTLPATTTTSTLPATTTTSTLPGTTTTSTSPVTTTTSTLPGTTTTSTSPVTTTTSTVVASTTTTTTTGSTTTTVRPACKPRPGAGPCPTTTTTTIAGIPMINSSPGRPGAGG